MSFPLSFPENVLSYTEGGALGVLYLLAPHAQMTLSIHSNLKATECPGKPIPASRVLASGQYPQELLSNGHD